MYRYGEEEGCRWWGVGGGEGKESYEIGTKEGCGKEADCEEAGGKAGEEVFGEKTGEEGAEGQTVYSTSG